MKNMVKFFLNKDYVFENFNFSWVFVSIFLLVSFGFFLDYKEMNINLYILFTSLILMLSTAFLKDFIKKDVLLLCLFVSLSISLSGFGFYVLLSLPLTVQTSIFWNSCLLLTLFFLPVYLFPVSVFFGSFIALTLFMFSQQHFIHTLLNCGMLLGQTGLFFIVWYFIYQEKESRIQLRENTLKENAIMMNHELRTYLATIQFNIEAIKKNPKKQNTLIIPIEVALKHMLIFLELMQANFNGYFPKNNIEKHSVKKMLFNSLGDYAFLEKELDLIAVKGEDFLIAIDESVFKHVVFNLLRNALFFIKKADKGSIDISLKSSEKQYMFIFQDTGYGIKEDIQQYIFDRFFSRTKTGTGMGLYFCKKALAAYGATILCESEFGHYTKFIICFTKDPAS